MNISAELDAAIKAVCPIEGVSIGRLSERGSWQIHFASEATEPQCAAAQVVLEAFDVEAAQQAEEAERVRLIALRADELAQELLTSLTSATAQQLSNYVDANVTDLASARVMFKRVLLILALVAKGA